ncbi:MAG: substrate-binding domain-containing protein [Sedimentisphaerales bacterium]|nr:substrate-binding domain-containing protein [Sedimentisphaerales bacterium]
MSHSTRKVIIVVEASTAYGRGILRGIAKYSRLHGPWSINMDPWEIYNRELPRMVDWQGEGIIARVSSEKVAEKILNNHLPTVTLASDSTKRLSAVKKDHWAVIPRVITSSRAIGAMAAEHFLDRGFRHFAFCGIPYCSWSQQRKEIFNDRIRLAGLHCHVYTEPRLRRDRTWEQEQITLTKWLTSLPKPVAVMACNDERARYVVETARIAGLMVPEEVAILGVDNDELLCDLSYPQLSSVALNVQQAGYEAAALLDKLMGGEPMAGQEIHVEPARVVVRQSTNILAISDKEVAGAIRFIREFAKEMIRVDDVVNSVSSSRRLLERRFQKVLGRSILKEIQRVRVESAKELLLKTDLPISSVSRESGFSNATHLGVIFRRETDLTPLSYRKRFRSR